MNSNMDEIFIKAANSNLTPNAVEFVPRSVLSIPNSLPGVLGLDNSWENQNGSSSRSAVVNQYDELFDYQNSHLNQDGSTNNHCERKKDERGHQDGINQGRPYVMQHSFYGKNSTRYKNFQRNNHLSSGQSFAFRHKVDKNFGGMIQGSAESNFSNFEKSCEPSDENDEHTHSMCASSAFGSVSGNRSRNKPHGNNTARTLTATVIKTGRGEIDQSITQRDTLIQQLNSGTLECLVCCDLVKQHESVWSCSNCYHVLHLWCVIKWAKSSKKESNKWRCPACQDEKEGTPQKYMCFCGKTKMQNEWNRRDTAHSCGELCDRNKSNPTPWFVCEHRCTLLCHPGPCPPCIVLVTRECGCGRITRNVLCSTKTDVICGSICDRLLSCGQHRCLKTCHYGECETCCVKLKSSCYCGKKIQEILCGTENLYSKFCCNGKCQRILDCGNHECVNICHDGVCSSCPKLPAHLNTCACGKKTLKENLRISCLDPISTCDQICAKPLSCGPTHKPHLCESLCHEDECPPCGKRTVMKCRCGSLEKSVSCSEWIKGVEFKCQKKCVKKRSCGKHKCNQVCCVDQDHLCSQRCNGTLSCGKHRCDLLCHRGKCGRCLQSSFEELFCHCGSSVIYPPVPCGTKPPVCDKPCRRQHDCEHPPLHSCHSDRECPPCIVFTDKLCHGGHELRKTIPCYLKEFSCGLPCGAPLPCGSHKCSIPCHPGECLSANKKCLQPCSRIRELCGHACAAPCHTGLCPSTLCRESVKVTCACGNLVVMHQCHEHSDDYQRIISATLATKMAELRIENSVSLCDLDEKINAQKINLRTLDCNDECKFIMRNRRLALALQIQNPDLSAKLTPKYSDFMKSWAKKDPALCRHVHEKLETLVKLAKESKQKSRSYSFEVMNKEKRQFVHEYCAHFGCESEAYDAEPKRNVVAIAVKGRCWLPAYSVLEVVQREKGQRKIPIPVFNKKRPAKSEENPFAAQSRTIILPVLPSASSSHTGINYFGGS